MAPSSLLRLLRAPRRKRDPAASSSSSHNEPPQPPAGIMRDVSSSRNSSSDADDSSSSCSDEGAGELPNLPKPTYLSRPRHSVSAEVYGEHNPMPKSFEVRKFAKSSEQVARIQRTCLNSFMFNHLEKGDLDLVISAFQEVRVKPGEIFIRQGDDGDCLYLIEEGDVHVSRKKNPSDVSSGGNDDGDEIFLCHMHPCDAVGELALLYNTPRAATCRATTERELRLWKLDRAVFNGIVKHGAQRRREMYEKFLQEVSLLDAMDPYERAKLSDALKTQTFNDGEYIITEGEEGHTFFIVETGEAEALKEGKHVMSYKRGDYFGELALLRDAPRAASVRARGDVKVISLERKSFNRLLGPLDKLLRRKASKYAGFDLTTLFPTDTQ